ncbi:MAG: sugar ABC transporter permease [Chloroflexi bacterium]|uniref:Sugar ABC transporter permease n=1 Tax=Candidatus Chlorohelix allophototropha TaxID=3003348 RepID=A0A8T7M9F4_9CHLR|nr:sugar ABC transporter permease [Chloroflexota bacterium]WJW68563.1 sugar ABC transporter permease [Chloroflexota bacterium L227-S17]
MQPTTEIDPRQTSTPHVKSWEPGQFFLSLLGLLVTLVVLWWGFLFLRGDFFPDAQNWFKAIFAIVWGVGGVASLFTVSNMLVEALPNDVRRRIQPYIFVGPGVAFLAWFLLIPLLRTFYQSFFDASSTNFVGLDNYQSAFTDRQMLESFKNNLLWLVLGTGLCVVLGLLIAVLADRSSFENFAKALIFLPMAISFVGAGVIFRFMFAYQPVDQPQIGVLNAVLVALGGQPQAWLAQEPWNTFFLIIVLVWMQTGYAMVLFSAALKGVPEDLLEAARIDGASEVQAFFGIIIPLIKGTIITVTTTIAIFTLKIFDVVIVMTGGQYGTEVVATQFYRQFFTNRNFGYGSAIAIVLFIAVLPVMIYNLRQLRKTEAF